MPTPKTECTEIAVGFGLLRADPIATKPEIAIKLFDQTLSVEQYNEFLQEFQRQEALYRRFYAAGLNLRSSYPLLARSNLSSVRWEGPRQQARSVSTPKDLVAANTAISVKANSNVVVNRSPHILFVSLPNGASTPTRAQNWYIETSRELYQSLYDFVRQKASGDYPASIVDFHIQTTEAERKRFASSIEHFSTEDRAAFEKHYRSMCRDVAVESASRFNMAVNEKLGRQSRFRKSVAEGIIREFFRISDGEYILCGIDRRVDFAVIIPDLTTWRERWELESITALPDVESGQSVVQFQVVTRDKQLNRSHKFSFHAEIRWSHGKFNGNPEAKLYKDFGWLEVPFFQRAYLPCPYRKHSLIGSGGFGTVYKAIPVIQRRRKPFQEIALKELSVHELRLEQADIDNAIARFIREVRIQESLEHPNILPVLASDLSGSIPWFVTPLALCSVADILDQLASNPERLKKIYRQVLEGMKYAHDRGVIHRDLKPDNVLLFANDVVKIADFGLGKRVVQGISTTALTSTDAPSMGSGVYTAPEQFDSFRDADHRADIYSLGVTLVAMLLGREPNRPILPQHIESVYREFIERCTQPSPDERFQSLEEVLAAFDMCSS